MSSQENGRPQNTVTGLALQTSISIVSSTNATPIVVTANAHGLSNGDAFHIGGHNVNFNANGTWVAANVTTNTVELRNTDGSASVGNGVGGATGFLQSQAIGSTYAIPSDTDPASAASVNVGFTALGDRSAFLAALAAGAYKLADVKTINAADAATDQSTAWLTITPAVNNVYLIAGAAGIWNPTGQFRAIVGPQNWPFTGDLIDVSFDTTVETFAGGTAYAVEMLYSLAWPVATASVAVPGARKGLNGLTAAKAPLHLGGLIRAGDLGQGPAGGQLQLALAGLAGATGGGQNIIFRGDYSLVLKLFRPTGVPQ
jgi:hypothetical protein